MKKTVDINEAFGTLYRPTSALVFYGSEKEKAPCYVEHFDMDADGTPINAHPLTVKEAERLAMALKVQDDKTAFLKPKGLMGSNILQLDPSESGRVIWFTKPARRKLFFVEGLGLPNGMAQVPALLWVADRSTVKVYALAASRRPTVNSTLHHAPFLNIYPDGRVCMGSVRVGIRKSSSLEEFTQTWENYFFNSYFTHLMNGHNPIKGNCVNLWKGLVADGGIFPTEVLVKTGKKLKDILR